MKRNQDKKLLEISQNFVKRSVRQLFRHPGLDAGGMPVKIPHTFVEIERFQSTNDETRRIFSMLVYVSSSQVIKPLDKTFFQFHNLFHTMKTSNYPKFNQGSEI